jgi:hypothetical protein
MNAQIRRIRNSALPNSMPLSGGDRYQSLLPRLCWGRQALRY